MILNLTLEYNPETESVKVKSCKVEKGIQNSPTVMVEESDDPQLILDSSKYTLNSAAVKMMGIKVDDRIDIKYQPINGSEFPVIGTEAAFGSGGGNKLTKSNTVSYRGKANDRLSEFGTVFTIAPLKGYSDLFVLISDSAVAPDQESPIKVPDEIEIKEDMNDHTDIPQEVKEEPLTFAEDSKEEPLNSDEDDDFSFDVDSEEEEEDSTLIEEDSLIFE